MLADLLYEASKNGLLNAMCVEKILNIPWPDDLKSVAAKYTSPKNIETLQVVGELCQRINKYGE